jgi:hypothetical protein
MKTFDTWWRLKHEALAAWQAQIALCDSIYRPGRTDGATPEEAEAIDAATRLAIQADQAANIAYGDYQAELCERQGGHDWTTYTSGGVYCYDGEVVEDLTDHTVCQKCGLELADVEQETVDIEVPF